MGLGSISRQIAWLPRAQLHEHATSWLNAVTRLAGPCDEIDRRGSETFLEAMHEEWDRRRDAPRPGDMASDWPANAEMRWYVRTEPGANSPLAVHGYHVGRVYGRPPEVRREILTRCYTGPLMPAFSRDAMEAWGAPGSAQRLARMKSFLDGLILDNTNRPRMKDAVSDWRTDVDFVRQAFGPPSGFRAQA